MRHVCAYQRDNVAGDRDQSARCTTEAVETFAMLRRSVLHEGVRHRRQKYDWDCGLACIQMVLPERAAKRFETDFHAICRDEGFAKSTWTIDLCYILRRFNLPHAFYTLILGAHSGYRHAAFYARVFGVDEIRVNKRFAEATACGLRVRRASLPLASVLTRLRKGPAIALTDASRLTCTVCKRNRLSADIRRCLPIPLPPPAYVGHYIVLCGYDLRAKAIYYRNPACHDHRCIMSLETFEDARRAFGTDEDIIFINNHAEQSKAIIDPKTFEKLTKVALP